MFSLASPAGLAALLGVLVPVAIHLWNRQPGRRVLVGSVRWLTAGSNPRRRRMHPEQLLLLLLRAFLVGVLALVAAGLRWQQPAPPRRGQLLISRELLLSPAADALRPRIDSLRQRGWTLRQLAPGWPELTPAAWRRPDSALAASPLSPIAPWLLVQQAADSFPGQPVHVYSSARQAQFAGSRPALPRQVRWQLVPLPDSARRWVQSAWQPTPDSLHLVLGHSTEDGIRYQRVRQRARPQLTVPGLGRWQYEQAPSGPRLLSASDTVPVRTRPLRAWLRTDAAWAEDARYLRAALAAIRPALAAPLQVTESSKAPTPDQPLDWLFWLSAAPLPAALPATQQVWQFPADAGEPRPGNFTGSTPTPMLTYSRLGRSEAPPTDSVAWQDAAGQPILTRATGSRPGHWRFRTRLHPAWSSLGHTPELPALLLPLLLPSSPPPSANDLRTLPLNQVLLTAAPAPRRPLRPAPPAYLDLRPWLVALAGGLLLLERLLAHRQARRRFSASLVA